MRRWHVDTAPFGDAVLAIPGCLPAMRWSAEGGGEGFFVLSALQPHGASAEVVSGVRVRAPVLKAVAVAHPR